MACPFSVNLVNVRCRAHLNLSDTVLRSEPTTLAAWCLTTGLLTFSPPSVSQPMPLALILVCLRNGFATDASSRGPRYWCMCVLGYKVLPDLLAWSFLWRWLGSCVDVGACELPAHSSTVVKREGGRVHSGYYEAGRAARSPVSHPRHCYFNIRSTRFRGKRMVALDMRKPVRLPLFARN